MTDVSSIGPAADDHRRVLTNRQGHPISRYTRAKVFREGTRTETALRFSTVAGGRDSSEVAHDPRGFAVKMYTEDGNWDLVGNNLGCSSSVTRSSSRTSSTLRSRTP